VSENLSLPEDITTLSAKQLNEFETAARKRAKQLYESQATDFSVAVQEADEMAELAEGIERVQAEKTRRATEAGERKAEASAKLAELVTGGDAEADDDEVPAEEPEPEAKPEPTPVAAANEPRKTGGATTNPRPAGKFKNPSLADAQRQAPSTSEPRPETVMTASADIPGFGAGQKLSGMEQLVSAMHTRARTLPVTSWGNDAPRVPIASLLREHRFTLGPDSSLAEFNEVMTAAANPDILVAAGGWCAPSEISYDFFNIACNAGRIDLPTIGINRGGIRWPVSPSFADVVLGGALWTWTETQDVAAVTGTGQSGTKTCGRVPCATFDEERLRCDGICLTVGNLTEDAFPELIANHTDLVMKSHDHKMNRLYIDAIRTLSAGFLATNTAADGVVAPVLGSLELQATDYRDRYAMCEDALIEVIAPRWLRGVMRSDLRRRMGASTDMLAYTDAQLMTLFDAANIRIQWVDDYQVRTAGFPGVPTTIPTVWPTTVEFLMYAPGTVVLGRGMRLDLGIIRDSVLNATNDHTAEWMEECWLIFQPGHEVRRLTVTICPSGQTGAADIACVDAGA
jgi:hypothetical protein